MGTVARLSGPFTYCSFGELTVKIVLQQSPGPFFCQAVSLVPGRYKKPEVVPAPPTVPPGSCAPTLWSVTCSRLACHPHQPGHLAATRCAEAEPRQVLSHQKPCPGLPPAPLPPASGCLDRVSAFRNCCAGLVPSAFVSFWAEIRLSRGWGGAACWPQCPQVSSCGGMEARPPSAALCQPGSLPSGGASSPWAGWGPLPWLGSTAAVFLAGALTT